MSRPLAAPVARIGQAPQPDALAIFRSAEGIAVLRPTQPLPVSGRFGGLLTVRLRAVALPPPIAGIAVVVFVAMQALGRGFRTHRRAQKNPPPPRMHAQSNEGNPAPAPPEEDAEEDAT